MHIDYRGMSEYHTKSERTLRRWEHERPDHFKILLDEYLANAQNSTVAKKSGGVVIAALSLKGGVGKSTVVDNFAFVLGSDKRYPGESDAVVLNLDLGQTAGRINASHTVDYIDYADQMSVSDLIDHLLEEYRYVIVDTPGDPTMEVMEAMAYVTKVIIPMTIGERSEEATMNTLATYFGEGTTLSGNFDVFFFYNNYTDRRKRDEASERFKQSYASFKAAEGITLRPKLGSLDASNAISTVEYKGRSVFQLAQENKSAYTIAARKIGALCSTIEEHFNLQ